jgi:ubiquinone/menaquinone biosynthesis C-methylase UbiE
MSEDEAQLIRQRYARRSVRYDPWEPWVYFSRQHLERGIVKALRRAEMFPPQGRSVLDLGCGTGNTLLFFLQLGFAPELLHGVDLLEQRISLARQRLPAAVSLEAAEASQFTGNAAGYDLVFQSMLFSSVLDRDLRRRIAANMWRMVKPGGGVLWYDFTWDNPRNPDVRGVRVSEIRELFPQGKVDVHRVTLAPPLARVISRHWPSGYGVFNLMPFLRTHVIAWISK